MAGALQNLSSSNRLLQTKASAMRKLCGCIRVFRITITLRFITRSKRFEDFIRRCGKRSRYIFNIGNEINQLKETKKFHLSLSVKAEVDITSSIDSKNDILRAVDIRLTALKDELVASFDHAMGIKCSTNDISDLESFAHHVEAKDIRPHKKIPTSVFFL